MSLPSKAAKSAKKRNTERRERLREWLIEHGVAGSDTTARDAAWAHLSLHGVSSGDRCGDAPCRIAGVATALMEVVQHEDEWRRIQELDKSGMVFLKISRLEHTNPLLALLAPAVLQACAAEST